MMTNWCLAVFRRVIALASVLIVHATVAQAVPVFYLSTETSGATPGLLNIVGPPPFSTGTLHIWASSDVRLAGVSLDLIEVGGAIKFTGLQVPNPVGPPQRWAFLDGPQGITNSAVTHIGGAMIPGLLGDGIGQGSQAGPNVLIASIPYMVTFTSPFSELRLRVGGNGIADFNGNFPQVRLGTSSAPLVNGDAFGAGGVVGSVLVHDCCGPGLAPVIFPVNLGEVDSLTAITANLQVSNGPVTWSGLTPVMGTPALPATLSEQGVFSWNPAGSQRGPQGNGVTYSWTATATNPAGQDTDVAISLRLIPEPATTILMALSAVSLISAFRRLPLTRTQLKEQRDGTTLAD
jgi:hypothetical protein